MYFIDRWLKSRGLNVSQQCVRLNRTNWGIVGSFCGLCVFLVTWGVCAVVVSSGCWPFDQCSHKEIKLHKSIFCAINAWTFWPLQFLRNTFKDFWFNFSFSLYIKVCYWRSYSEIVFPQGYFRVKYINKHISLVCYSFETSCANTLLHCVLWMKRWMG